MMKFSVLLGGSFLFSLLFWNSSGLEPDLSVHKRQWCVPKNGLKSIYDHLFHHQTWILWAVTSMCSDDWLITRIKRRPFDNDTEIRIGDIHLGNNCPVTSMLTFSYEFSYPVISCGIRKIVFQGNDVFILSEINYRPTLNTVHEFQVVCLVKRLLLSSLSFGMNGNDVSASSQATKEGQHPSDSSQSKKCEANFSSCNKDQVPMNHWFSNACIKPFSLP